jgi:hypothetical protein
MKTHPVTRFYLRVALLSLLSLLAVGPGTGKAQTVTQTFQLRNGWNSIWLEVEPTNAETAVVFGNLPVSSVWTYVAKNSPIQFIQDQTEDQFNQPAWLRYFPAGKSEAFLNNLFAVQGLRAYLVKLTNGPATLTVTGRPVVRAVKWTTDSFNLRGFPVNPAQLPTFATFFGPSTAHAGQRIYQLGNDGHWAQVDVSAAMKHGEAYWVYAQGASTYPGPLGFDLDTGDGLDYGTVLVELAPKVKNNSPGARAICVQDLTVGANNPLSYQSFFSNRLNWVNLPAPYCFSVDGGGELDLRLAIRRKDFTGNDFGSILEIKDDIGTRYLVPVTGSKLIAARSSLTAQPGGNGVNDALAGLWVGSASLTNVSEANSSEPNRVTPVRSPFELRLLMHVNTNGEARLLKEVIQMWQNGTKTNDALGRQVVDKAGRFVLLTSDSLIPQYQGASLRDGVPVGRRFSTVDFDFDGGAQNLLALNGGFGMGHTTQGTIVLEPNHSTNPFMHRFHPDHDNLNATYQSYKEEAYRITRKLEFQFTPFNPDPNDRTLSSLEYGYSVLGGIYRETVSGLHKTNIIASGTFRLTRVCNSPVLNQ